MSKQTVTHRKAEAVAHMIDLRREDALYPRVPMDTIVDNRPAAAGWVNRHVA